ncbi:MFS transporter [Bartonella tamiae]|uniref:Major facilitator superfamily (MFS) profile domain-containing protein n=1 Tax=Bartonella tamiae Th239 TaxID=1094558 RepID=J0QWA5_9HYPH|nr:MFS transporter [Bartonella tamiae]EJF90306.1 hypothetical protein ME5_00707 [Bartonella tamiae Th239]EJF93753.1 hypothetical protein MEG_01177 [Bartonella tamiae Th307]
MQNNQISLFKIIPLSLTAFIAIMTETMPVGMLPEISSTFNIPSEITGQIVTFYAVGACISVIPIIASTRHLNRKVLLLAALLGFFITNIAVAFTSNFNLVLIERFLSGVSAGTAWGILNGYAIRITPPEKHGRVIAIVAIGQPIALAIGVPLASYFVRFWPWQHLFFLISIVAFIVILWAIIALPNIPGQTKTEQIPILKVILKFKILIVLFATWLIVVSHNILYIYISDYLNISGIINRIDFVLALFGIFSIIGIVILSAYIDKHLKALSYIFVSLFFISNVVFYLFSSYEYVVYFATIIWGISFGGIPTILNKYLADRAKRDIDIAQSGFVTFFNLAIAVAGGFGGLVLAYSSANTLPLFQIIFGVFLIFIFYKYLIKEPSPD